MNVLGTCVRIESTGNSNFCNTGSIHVSWQLFSAISAASKMINTIIRIFHATPRNVFRHELAQSRELIMKGEFLCCYP